MGSAPFVGLRDLKGFSGGGGAGSPSSLVLDGDGGRLVVGPTRLGRKGGGGGSSDARAAMALKSHSEAERRRRERINSHLDTLRSMIPCTDKMDKAALLAEVIRNVKELKSQAIEISKTCTIPSDVDEVRVEVDRDGMNNGIFLIKATLSCEDRPELFADLRQTLHALQLRTVGAEVSSLGSRVKNVFMLSWEGNPDDYERHLFISSVHQALKSVLDRATEPDFLPRTALKSVLDRATEPDFLPRTAFSSKRQRTSLFESSCSSS